MGIMEEKQYMDWPTAQKLLKELSDQAKAIREEYLQTCGKPLEGKFFRERGISYKVETASLGADRYWTNETIYLKCYETNSRGEPSERTEILTLAPRRYFDEPIANEVYSWVLEGLLCLKSNAEEDELLAVGDSEGFLTEILQGKIKEYGNMLTVRYWLSDEPLSLDELTKNFIAEVSGSTECSYNVRYSEYTGYLGTDEEFNVGGHDLLAELKSEIGKFIRLEINFDR